VPTLLVTSRMSPALAARVQAAVSGRHARRRPLKAALRLLTFAFVLTSVVGIVHFRQQRVQQLETRRAELLASLEQAGHSLTRTDRELPTRVAAAIALETAPLYAGDLFAQDVRSAAHLTEALSLPTLYLRGPLDALARPERVSEVASGSSKDALVLCLLAVPDARTEKALRAKASAAYAGGKSVEVTAHIERLAPLVQALPLLGREWATRIQVAETPEALQTLQKLVDAAPLAAAVRAAKARQLLLVLDETGAGSGPSELDGERAHPVRVVLTDLTNGETRLRFRHDVDPGWLSDHARAQYASGIDSCALAMDVRAAATTAAP
jgi:hypothetical protein